MKIFKRRSGGFSLVFKTENDKVYYYQCNSKGKIKIKQPIVSAAYDFVQAHKCKSEDLKSLST
jgi:hypothetical protein